MVKTKDLNVKHGDYARKINSWEKSALLACGGADMLAAMDKFLFRRPAEDEDVYRDRLNQCTYNSLIGSIIGWYQSAISRNKPSMMVFKDGTAVKEKQWWGQFESNVDRNNKTLYEYAADMLRDLLVFGEAWALVDLPKSDGEKPRSLADQMQAGALDAFLVRYAAPQVYDWSEDEAGRLLWVKIKATIERRAFLATGEIVDVWYYFDRERFEVYEAPRRDGKEAEQAFQTAAGRHAMADLKTVPVLRFRVPEELWLANRVLPQLIEHVRTENGLANAVDKVCYPWPYIKGDFDDKPIRSMVTFLKLAADGDAGYVEISGTGVDKAVNRCAAIREDVYRACYLQAQGRSTEATPAAQSGYSKEMDMLPSLDILNKFGSVLRSALVSILDTVAKIRGEVNQFAVSGYEFDTTGTDNALDQLDRVDDVGIESDTLRRVLSKRAVRSLLTGEDPAIVAAAEKEIDQAPSIEEQKKAEVEARRVAVAGTFGR